MSIKKINQLPDGSGNLSNDDLFIFMDNPSGSGVTKKISLSQLISALGGGSETTIVNVSGLQSALDGKQPSGNYAASSHTHTSSNITDFNSSVSGLLPSGLVRSNTSGIIGASGINNVVQINQADYNALVSKDPNTVYFVV
jgi:hypothetical protein